MTKTVTLVGTTRNYVLEVSLPDSPVFLYSPQILTVRNGNVAQPIGASQVRLKVTGSLGSHVETRTMLNDVARFDMSRVMQLVTPDVDDILSRIGENGSLCDSVTLDIDFIAGDTGEVFEPVPGIDGLSCTVLHGALDQLETYGGTESRRMWLNFPQTFNLWRTDGEEAHVIINGITSYVPFPEDCVEVDQRIIRARLDESGADLDKAFIPGRPADLGLSLNGKVSDGAVSWEYLRTITVTPDDSKPGDGVYLRWLDRRGEAGYWLLTGSEIEYTANTGQSFSRYYEGNPAAPRGGSYVNAQKVDFRETRTMTLSATGLSLEEYDYLCSLAVSPVVEMLVVTQDMIDSGDATEATRWQRVNIAPSTHSRSIRRRTPRLYDFEVVIELPERNTVTL